MREIRKSIDDELSISSATSSITEISWDEFIEKDLSNDNKEKEEKQKNTDAVMEEIRIKAQEKSKMSAALRNSIEILYMSIQKAKNEIQWKTIESKLEKAHRQRKFEKKMSDPTRGKNSNNTYYFK